MLPDDSQRLSSDKNDDYCSLEMEPPTTETSTLKRSSWLGLALGALTIAAVGLGAGWAFAQGGPVVTTNDGVPASNEVQAMITKQVTIPSQAQVAEMAALCEAWYHCEVGEIPIDVETGLPEAPGPGCIAERATHLLRWSFHDCATRSDSANNGGCFACNAHPGVQRSCPDNNGLQLEVDELKVLRDQFLKDPLTLEYIVSLPDWLHFCTAVGVKLSSEQANAVGQGTTINMLPEFEWGRTECVDQGEHFDPVCGYTKRLPASRDDWEIIKSKMMDEGFNPVEIVVIDGSHNMGGSGAHSPHGLGSWTADDGIFGNQYYCSIQERNWRSRPTVNPAATGDKVQYFGNFFSNPDGTVTAVQGDCPPFQPTDAAGNPLPVGHEPGCFITNVVTGEEICDTCGELMALHSDLEQYFDFSNPPGCSIKQADIDLGAAPCALNADGMATVIELMCLSQDGFAEAYKDAHLHMTKFGQAHHMKPPGLLPEKFSVEYPDPPPAPVVPAPPAPVTG